MSSPADPVPHDDKLKELMHRYDSKTGPDGDMFHELHSQVVSNNFYSTKDKSATIYYELYGHGEQKVLLLGGMGSVSDSWGRLVVEFLKHPQFQVCVYDFRGIRYSTTTKPRFTTSMLANDVIELLDHFGWPKSHVIGFSLGGFVVTELLRDYPTRIESAVVAGGSTGRFLPSMRVFYQMGTVPFIRTQAHRMLHLCKIQLSEEFLTKPQPLLRGMTGKEYITQPIEQTLFEPIQTPFPLTLKASGACFTHYIPEADLKKIKEHHIPLLVLHGTADLMVPYSHGVYTAKQLDGQLIPFTGCGHLITIEACQSFNENVICFLTHQPLPGFYRYDRPSEEQTQEKE